MAEGRTEQRNEIITRLHSKGMSLEQISEMLDISLDEIQTILTKK
jgi:lambda repressor-like predicted transcriptional regulator